MSKIESKAFNNGVLLALEVAGGGIGTLMGAGNGVILINQGAEGLATVAKEGTAAHDPFSMVMNATIEAEIPPIVTIGIIIAMSGLLLRDALRRVDLPNRILHRR